MENKRQFLGSTEIRSEYWSKGKGSEELKRNETYIFALIDLGQEKLGIANTYDQAQIEYNKQDMYYLCLTAIEIAGSNNEMLARFGIVIGNMIREGKIYKSYISIEAENDNLMSLSDEMIRRADQFAENNSNDDFNEWFEYHILRNNYFANYDGSITYEAPRLSGLGTSSDSDELTQRAKDTGFYFVYLLNDTDSVYDGAVDEQALRSKIAFQNQYLNWIERKGTNLTADTVLVAAESGIIRDMKMSASEALETLKGNRGIDGMGVLTEAAAGLISAIITAVITAAITLIGILVNKKSTEAATEAYLNASSPSNGDINANAPSAGEYGYEESKELQDKIEKMENKLEFYDKFPDAAIIGVSISVWTLIFGAAIFASRKKK